MLRPRPWFALEAGGLIDAVSARDGDRSLHAIGGFPYVRSRFADGALSAAITGAGFAASGGEGGMLGGFADVQLGVGGERWSVYGGAYALGYAEANGGPSTAAAQGRIGVEVLIPVSRVLVGIAVEGYRQVDSLRSSPDMPPLDSSFPGLGLKLRVEADDFLRTAF